MSTSYHVYGNAGSGPIDYTTVLATVSGLTWLSAALSYPAVWKFGVRAWDTVSTLEEHNIDAVVAIQLSAAGTDVSAIPAAPLLLSGHARANGAVILDWHYPVSVGSSKPTGFHIYQGTGGGPSYGSPVATVAYSTGIQFFTAKVLGLTDGTAYSFGVRAYNATGEEANTMTTTVTADATGPPPVYSLTAGTIP